MEQAELDNIRRRCLKAVAPIRAGTPDQYFWGQRTTAGRDLPPYYIVYFLLVDLLAFPVLGRQEKVAWSIVLLYEENVYVLEHRKLGLGVFATDKEDPLVSRIVNLLKSGVSIALPYYKHRAESALSSSKINLLQKSHYLLERSEYLIQTYETQRDTALVQKDVVIKTPVASKWGTAVHYSHPYYGLARQAEWLATAAIEAFFSWTEHFFIHLAVLRGNITSGNEIVSLAGADWATKYKTALDIQQPDCKSFYDRLLHLRRQVRNFVSHGAFGKDGEAFHFHSPVGAIPVYLRWEDNHSAISMHDDLSYDEETAITLLKDFIAFIRSGSLATASQYINDSHLDTILTYANDGTYRSALTSPEAMQELIERMNYVNAMHANMDW